MSFNPMIFKIRAFASELFREFTESYANQIFAEIKNKGKEYIIGVEEQEFQDYLIEKYTLEPLEIIITSEDRKVPIQKKKRINRDYDHRSIEIDVYDCEIVYHFTGNPILFKYQPSSWIMQSYEITVNSNIQTVSFSFIISKQDEIQYNNDKTNAFSAAFSNIKNINIDVENWNKSLPKLVNRHFTSLKGHYQKENSFFEAIKVNVDPNTKTVFTPPTIKKKTIPQPPTSKREFTQFPTWPMETYQDTLSVLFETGKSMEKKPSTYRDRDEEDIRDYLITLLETRYEAATVGGETFNKGGKTDILIKYQDGSNLFVGECKWWKGEREFNAAINQLFDNYLTWRDSKTALLFFVKNKEITKVCEKINEEAQKHPYYKRFDKSKGEGRYSFIFHLPGDPEKEIFLEIMAFHFIDSK
jgi:hypothetical protein